MPDTGAPQELGNLLEEKREELARAGKSNWSGGALKTLGGGAVGFLAGTAAWMANGVKIGIEAMRSTHGDLQRYVRIYEKLSPAARQEMIEKSAEKMVSQMQRTPGLSGAIFNNPGTFVATTSLLGAGGMLWWHSADRKENREKVGHEVATLEKIADSWQERTAQSREEDKDVARQK